MVDRLRRMEPFGPADYVSSASFFVRRCVLSGHWETAAFKPPIPAVVLLGNPALPRRGFSLTEAFAQASDLQNCG